MKLVWTPSALQDRRAARNYISRDNLAAALALDTLFSQRAGTLVDHSALGRPGRVVGTRELVVHSNYILVYDVHGEAVRILRLLHARQRWPEVE